MKNLNVLPPVYTTKTTEMSKKRTQALEPSEKYEVAEKVIRMENYSPHLFWDVDKKDLILNQYKELLVKRVLGYGTMSDRKQINLDLGLKQITLIALQIRDLDPKGANLISLLSGIPIEEFRCYTFQQLNPGRWNF